MMLSASTDQGRRRRLGQSMLHVSPLGLGCAGLAGLFEGVAEDDGRATIRHALAHGITYLDTAPQYGYGRSEHLVGEVARSASPRPIVSTKVGRLLRPVSPAEQKRGNWVDPLPFAQHYDYTYDGIMRSHEDSLQRMGLDRVDILNVHDIGPVTHGEEQSKLYWRQLAEGGYRALHDLRGSGAIQAIGMGVNEAPILLDALALGEWDLFLLAGRYTLLDQSGEHPLFDACLRRGTSIVIGGPFNSGILVGRNTYNYRAAPDHIVRKARELHAVCEGFGVPLPAAALQFPLRHPAVASVIPGPRSIAELNDILSWWERPIPEKLWASVPLVAS